MLFIKKIVLFILFNIAFLVNIKADMLFYYSSAILPSIMSTEQTKTKIVSNYTGDFISTDGTRYPMTAIITPDLSIRLFLLDPFQYAEDSELQMQGTLTVQGNTVKSTLTTYLDSDKNGIATQASTMLIKAIYTPISEPTPPIDDLSLKTSSATNISVPQLSGTYSSSTDHGTFVLKYNQNLNIETNGFAEYEPARDSFFDEISVVEINQSGHMSSYGGNCSYVGQFDQINPNTNLFSLSVDFACDSRPTSTYYGFGILVDDSDRSGEDDYSVIFSVSNGTESIVDYMSPQY